MPRGGFVSNYFAAKHSTTTFEWIFNSFKYFFLVILLLIYWVVVSGVVYYLYSMTIAKLIRSISPEYGTVLVVGITAVLWLSLGFTVEKILLMPVNYFLD
jgi:hypothetical protein